MDARIWTYRLVHQINDATSIETAKLIPSSQSYFMFVKQSKCKVKDAVIASPTSETYSKYQKLKFPLKIVAILTIEGFLVVVFASAFPGQISFKIVHKLSTRPS